MHFTLYTSNTRQMLNNVYYQNKHVIKTVEDLVKASHFDHVSAEFKDYYRANHNFIQADNVAMDVDNDHSENVKDWLDIEKLKELLPDVTFMVSYSRNHMKQKGEKSPRPRFHVYFPTNPIRDSMQYKDLKKRIANAVVGFDKNALDASRLLFGVENPQVEYVEGIKTIDEYLDERLDSFESLDFNTGEVIEEGSRNSTLSQFAGRILMRFGETDQAYQLFLEKAATCQQPLSDDELQAIWRSALKFGKRMSQEEGYIPPDEFNSEYLYKPDDYSDVGQALVLAEHFGDKLRYSTATDYLVYNGKYWNESNIQADGVVRSLTDLQLAEAEVGIEKYTKLLEENGGKQLLDNMAKKKAMEAFNGEQSKVFTKLTEAKNYREFVLKRRNQNYIQAALGIGKHLVEIDPSDLDSDAFLLNTPTATYDLRTSQSFAHQAEHYITKQTNVGVKEDTSNIWQEALETFFLNDQELIDYVQEIVGLSAIGKVYVEALIIAYGDGRNGKSTFWNTIAKVLGSYSGNMSADTLTNQVRRNVKPELAEAKGKRLLIASELQEGMSLNTSIIKQLCSTDEIYAEKKYKSPFSYTPSHTLVLYTNHLPKVNAMDEGTWRRLIVIPFEATIKGNNDIKNFSDYLYQNAGEEILWWIIQGAKRVIEKNFKISPPQRVMNAIETYKNENDWFGHFLETCCDIEEGYTEQSGKLYTEYRAYCFRVGEKARSTTDFYKELESSGFMRRKTRKGTLIYGLALKEAEDEFI